MAAIAELFCRYNAQTVTTFIFEFVNQTPRLFVREFSSLRSRDY